MHTERSSSFADLLKRHRLAAGLSQEELAGRAGLSPRGVSDLERGAHINPRPATVRLLTDTLGLADTDRAAFLAAAQANAPARQRQGTEMEAAAPAPTRSSGAVAAAPSGLPSGTVTFLFTDIEGSTQLLQALGPRYVDVLGTHQRILRAAFAAHSGYEVDTQGDSFFAAFPTARDALACAVEAQRALESESWPEGVQVRVRMGLHSGAPQLVGNRYMGLDVHRAARIAAAGHGGQVLLSEATSALVRHDLPQDSSLRDLGAHRLKDLQQPEHLYQLIVPELPPEFPALKALDARPHNLPVQPSPILGREREIEALCTLLRRDDVRLVTLTGPGGVGKTRLSLQVAAEVLDAFPDGVWNVRLSRLSDPALVVPTIAAALELKESGATSLAEVVRNHLRDKRLLVVLDNFEQVVSAAPSVGELVEHCAGLKLLVTSRVPLHLHGEREYLLKPLALPDPAHLPPLERLSQYAAVALFIERAQAARADFEVTSANAAAVAAICARLDGLPLAIELAAARVKLLPPPALLARLERALPVLTGGARDVDERQQTMRNTLVWSYDLLSSEEQRLFRRLAVFVGGCTLDAAEAVCATPKDTQPLQIPALDGLSALVDNSLVQQREEGEGGEPRFVLLYVIREFALERLEASGEAEALRRAHAVHILAQAERAEPELVGRQAGTWLDRIEREHDNVRAALGWAQQQGEAGIGLRLASALGWFWYKRGHLGEGRTWMDGLLNLMQQSTADVLSLSEQAKALREAGMLAWWGTDYDAAWSRLEHSVVLAKTLGNLSAAADALDQSAVVAFFRHESERALALFDESLALARQAGDSRKVSTVLVNQGYVAYHLGDFATAEACIQEGLAMHRARGDQHAETIAVVELGELARRRGDLDGARAQLRDALHLVQQVGDPRLYAETLQYLARTLANAGQGQKAARLLGVAAKLRDAIGFPESPIDTADTDAAVAPSRAALGELAWNTAYEAGRALSLEEAVAEALGEEGTPAGHEHGET